ncbi:hypothetical protein [Streptomyces tropicalis]|uniref:Nucleopolyhedrovirus P10 family protein n=1 Tax=Streptomyces tropicalis TaxID=3034234 RepID=A0ABT6AC22_9ACTN|nr:hypothetical protein [Streptomyces tropicalis]MDF3302198.1 hypothetical protein [Streptomyces tropicalis]
MRSRMTLGRLLPLGGPRDGAWIAERAAEAVLRRAAQDAPGVRLGALRIALSDPALTAAPVVPPPPSALPPGDLRVRAEFAATADEPLPAVAARLREVLAAAATGSLGLTVTDVDLHVTTLLNGGTGPADRSGTTGLAARTPQAGSADTARAADTAGPAHTTAAPADTAFSARPAHPTGPADAPDAAGGPTAADTAGPAGTGAGGVGDGGAEDRGVGGSRGIGGGGAGGSVAADARRAAGAALAVPGVLRLTGALGGGPDRVVLVETRSRAAALPHRHVRVELAVRADHRAVAVARAVRAAVTASLPDRPSVAVLITEVG